MKCVFILIEIKMSRDLSLHHVLVNKIKYDSVEIWIASSVPSPNAAHHHT